MGMFDYIECHYGDCPDIVYQTKDTPEQYLEKYLIDKDGNLFECFMSEKTQINFRGNINFYGADKKGVRHEYDALFLDGRIIDFRRVEENEFN